MKIGVISDTHIPVRSLVIPPRVYEIFAGVEQILHAGDIEDERVLDELAAVAPVLAVAGNMDANLRHLPYRRELCLAECRVGLIHGSGLPRERIREKLRREFKQAQIVVYGHTHQPFWGQENGIWFMNPGSPTDTFFSPYLSVGLLELEADAIRGEIIRL